MFCGCSTAYDGARAEQPRLPGLPRAPRGAAGHQPGGRRARARDGPGDRGEHPRRDPLGSQELLLPGPAQGLPDQPVRPAARVARPAGLRHLGRAVHGDDHAGASRGGHGQARPRDRGGRAQGQPRRLQPVRRAADGDRDGAGDPDRRAGPPLRRGAAAAPALDRRVRRGHGARPAPGGGERLAPAARQRAVRDAGRGQEHELVPGRRAGHRLRDRAPGGGARRRRAPGPGDPWLVRGARRDVPDAGQGDLGRLPLLPGAGPAAAAHRSGLARRRPRASARAAGPAPGTLPGRAGTDAVRRRGPRRRPGCGVAVRGDPRGRPGAALEDRRDVGHRGVPASAQRRVRPVRVDPAELAAIIAAVADGSISRANGREVLDGHVESGASAATIIEARGFRQISDTRGARVDRGRRPRGQPRGGRRLSRREAAGRRLPRRPGDEGDARPGERAARGRRGPRAPRAPPTGAGEPAP